MPRTFPRVVLAGKTRHERQQRRQGIRLRDYTISEKTKQRYAAAVGRVLPFLEVQEDLSNMDAVLCDYIEWQWSRGESIGTIADGLSGLHHFWPEIKGHLRMAWKLFRSWRRIEAPQRAPPLTVTIVCAVIARAVSKNDIIFATLFALGFHCLLRTGEILAIQYKDIEFTQSCGIVSLLSSKSGLRTGTEEAVAVRDKLVLDLLHTLFSLEYLFPGQKLWPFSAQAFRDRFESYMRFFRICHLRMKPYSLRRGGATFLLQEGLPIDCILLRGRWKSLGVARLYLEDGLSQIPQVRVSREDQLQIDRCACECPSTAFRP